jgi:hypothetical protein
MSFHLEGGRIIQKRNQRGLVLESQRETVRFPCTHVHFILSYGRSNRIWCVLHFLPVSYILRNSDSLVALLPTFFVLVSGLLYLSTLKMEAKCYSVITGDFQMTTQRYNLKDRTLHNHRCENLKSYLEYRCPQTNAVALSPRANYTDRATTSCRGS